MTERDGRCCELCGYPAQPDDDLCEPCRTWQGIAASAEQAIEFAEAEQSRGGIS